MNEPNDKKLIVKVSLSFSLDDSDRQDDIDTIKKIIEWFDLDIGWFENTHDKIVELEEISFMTK